MRTRAFRRQQRLRIKYRVATYYGGYARHDARQLGRLATTRTPCSCWMCGNARRHRGEVALQERRADTGT